MNPTELNTLALAYNPAMLALRFLFELAALGCFALWAWRKTPSPWRWITVVALPVAIGWAWGTFAVSGDESRSGETEVETPGPLRLLLELAVFFGAVWALYDLGIRKTAKWALIVLVVFHILSYDRIWWLLTK
ncbi:YrdB family protein [Streptomyces sp. 21So2-11]|uniref:YrdB family protein n=1 Tax=Streptomyces sp. 21So2-11 TaxID=3144408 RepID=UPI0032198F43